MRTTEFDVVLDALRQAAETHETLTTDEVWLYLSNPPAVRNTVGKAFSEAARLGWITGTERFVRSRRPEAKGRRVQVWASQLQPGSEPSPTREGEAG